VILFDDGSTADTRTYLCAPSSMLTDGIFTKSNEVDVDVVVVAWESLELSAADAAWSSTFVVKILPSSILKILSSLSLEILLLFFLFPDKYKALTLLQLLTPDRMPKGVAGTEDRITDKSKRLDVVNCRRSNMA